MKKFFRRVWIVIRYLLTETYGQDKFFVYLSFIFIVILPLLCPLMAISPNFVGTGSDILVMMALCASIGLIFWIYPIPFIIRLEWEDIKIEFKADDAERYAATPEGQEQARREAEERRRKEAEKNFHSLETYPFEFEHKCRMVKQPRSAPTFNRRANSLTCEFFEYCKTRYQDEEQQRQKAELEAELEAERRAESERT